MWKVCDESEEEKVDKDLERWRWLQVLTFLHDNRMLVEQSCKVDSLSYNPRRISQTQLS